MTGDLGFGPNAEKFDPDAAAKAIIAKREEDARKPFPVLGVGELLTMRDPEWLLEGILPDTGFAVLYGPPGAGKSFVALDWALTIASGLDWFGRRVQRGTVVYVAGEGVAGVKQRLKAWQATHPGNPEGWFFMVPEAPNLLDIDHAERLRATLNLVREQTGKAASLLVIDTMARSLVGGDENSAKDVGLFIAHVDALSKPAASLVLHHTQKASTVERGSSSLRGAADVMVSVTPAKNDRTRFTLASEKSKDSEPFEDIRLLMRPVENSIALVRDITPPKQSTEDQLKHRVLGVIAQADGPLSLRGLRGRVKGSQERIKEAIEDLIFEEHIERTKDGFKVCPARSGTSGTPSTSDPREASVPQPEQPRRGPASGTVPEPPLADASQGVPGVSADAWPCDLHDAFWISAAGLVCGACHPPPAAGSVSWVERPNDDEAWEAGL